MDDNLPTGGAAIYTGTWDDSYANQWWHLTWVRATGSIRRLYINGSLVMTQNGVEAYGGTNTTEFRPGIFYRLSNKQAPFQGGIFDLRMYSSSLTANQISGIYSGRGRDSVLGSDMVFRTCIQNGYTGNSLSGKTVYDHSTYKNHLTTTGSPTVVEDPYSVVKTPTYA